MRLPALALLCLSIPAASMSGGCWGGGGGGGPDAAPPDAEPPPPAPLAPLRIRRLLARQYENAVRDLLGPAAAEVADPPGDLIANGFAAIGAAELSLSDKAVGRYEFSARAIAEEVLLDPAPLVRWLDCEPSGPADEACLESFLSRFGRAAWRRPLTEDEIDRYLGIATEAAAEYGSFHTGIEYLLIGLLQSPNFLYQIEVGEPDPEDPDRVRLTSYELATRLSFFLQDTTPGEELLDAAEAGELDTEAGVRAAARRILSRPGARRAFEAFYAERFKLEKLATLPKDSSSFPEFDAELARSMRREATELLNDIVWETDSDYRELLTARYAFVDAELASVYNVEPPEEGFEQRMLPAEQDRAGVLGQAAFLALGAHPASTSPTRRGRFVSQRMLCVDIPPPPPEVTPELPPDPGEPETMREKLERHMEDPGCASCHSRMDPIGLALEHFDAIGRHRTTDDGLPLDLSGEIMDLGSFYGGVELGELLAESQQFHDCWVKNVYRHATAHVETGGDHRVLESLGESFAGSGYRVRELLVELVASEGFRYAGPREEGE